MITKNITLGTQANPDLDNVLAQLAQLLNLPATCRILGIQRNVTPTANDPGMVIAATMNVQTDWDGISITEERDSRLIFKGTMEEHLQPIYGTDEMDELPLDTELNNALDKLAKDCFGIENNGAHIPDFSQLAYREQQLAVVQSVLDEMEKQ